MARAPKAPKAPRAPKTAEAPNRPKAIAPARASTNTWWCGVCGAGNRVGAEPDQACGSCGTPVLVA